MDAVQVAEERNAIYYGMAESTGSRNSKQMKSGSGSSAAVSGDEAHSLVPSGGTDAEAEVQALQAQIAELNEKLRALQHQSPAAPQPESNEDVKAKFITMRTKDGQNHFKTEGKQPWEETKSTSDFKQDAAVDLEFLTYLSKEGVTQKIEIKILSKALQQRLKEIVKGYLEHDENEKLWDQEPLTIQSDNAYIFYCWDHLSGSASKESDPVSKQLRYLLRFMEYTESELRQAQGSLKPSGEPGDIMIEYLWLLFPPAETVIYRPFQKEPQLFIVDNWRWDDTVLDEKKGTTFVISCWGYDWDGRDLVGKRYEVRIDDFKKPKKITELPIYPVKFHKDIPDLLDKLKARGEKFRKFCVDPEFKSKILHCSSQMRASTPEWKRLLGSSFRHEAIIEAKETLPQQKEGYRVIVDTPLFESYAPGIFRLGSRIPVQGGSCDCNLCSTRTPIDRKKSFKDLDVQIEDDLYHLLPPRLLGYALDRKQWVQIPVEHLNTNPPEDTERWNALSLEEEHKDRIMKMVKTHLEQSLPAIMSASPRIRDPVAGKGEGLVILLHGIPGVGKTLTAETLAMHLHCPLLRIEASELDFEHPADVNRVLQQYFDMAAKWRSILLLDEADVFLQARMRSEIKQNALVSVLLRSLEYFSGVLFMTTNRIKTIDAAVQSRIHYAVRFGRLDQAAIETIWLYYEEQIVPKEGTDNEGDTQNTPEHIERIRLHRERVKKDKQGIHEWFEKNKKELARSGMNGRDIRNLFVSAQLLAWAKDDKRLTRHEIQDVYSATTDFRRELEIIRNKAEEQGSIVDPSY